MWQHRATRASSQSSRKRRLTSPAQSLQQEHDIHDCAHTPRNAVYTHSRPKRLRLPRSSNEGFSGSHTSSCLPGQEKCCCTRSSFCGYHTQTNQCTSLQRLSSNSRPEFPRPTLPWNIPDAFCRAQTHSIPRLKRPSLPVGSFPHLLQNLCTSQAGHHSHRPRTKQRNCVTRASDLRPTLKHS